MRAALPPSPPMSSDASFEGYNSPSTKSVSQLSTSSNYYFETTPPLSHMDERHMAAVPRVHQIQTSAYQQHYAPPAYMSQPAMASYYPPMQPTPPPQPQMQGLYYQRPLPQVCSSAVIYARQSLTNETGLSANASVSGPCAYIWSKPLAASPLHRTVSSSILPPVSGPLHLPNMQQGILPTELAPHSQPLPHGREAIQVPSPGLRKSLQRAKQHETPRAGMPQL